MENTFERKIRNFFKKNDVIYINDISYIHCPEDRKSDTLVYLTDCFLEKDNLHGKKATVISDQYLLTVDHMGYTHPVEFVDIECEGKTYTVVASDKKSHFFTEAELKNNDTYTMFDIIDFMYHCVSMSNTDRPMTVGIEGTNAKISIESM